MTKRLFMFVFLGGLTIPLMFVRRRESLRWQNWIKCCLQRRGLSCTMFFGNLEVMPGRSKD